MGQTLFDKKLKKEQKESRELIFNIWHFIGIGFSNNT
jgi:hypothetical protein